MSERVTAQGVDLRSILPVRGLTVQGELTLDEEAKRRVETHARELIEADGKRSWADCEEEAAVTYAQEALGAVGFVVAEAELL